jgi:hypothetical protein
LQDTHSIVATLEAGIGFLFHFVFAAIYLLVWGMDIVKGFSTFSATVLALTFVFGNSVRCAAARRSMICCRTAAAPLRQ